KFKTEHTELILDPVSISVIEELIANFGEPFADTSAIPTYYISKAVSKNITVAISGDGGDEMFGGYDTYSQVKKAFSLNKFLIPFLPILCLLNQIKLNERVNKKIRQAYISAHLKRKIYPLSRTFYYGSICKDILNQEIFKKIDETPFELYSRIFNSNNADDLMDKVFYTDIKLPLANTLLPKVDITAMSNSIEVRAPFLDNNFVRFALNINSQLKMQNGIQKIIPKKALEEYFPHEFIYRKKQGFSPPIKSWLLNDFRGYLLDILSPNNLKKHEIIKADKVNEMINEFLSGRFNHSPFLWILLNFQIWFNHYNPGL
ncbi:hypothetical protein KAU33_03320, partial [Candidatus Dependentiae bacterium]|nr:hypothetical protein [Candidatus Dependentiae bacterium]